MTDKYGFVYIWFDRKHKRYYVGSHWGTKDDGYVCSSPWMKQAYLHRPKDFRRRILTDNIQTRDALRAKEQDWLKLIKLEEIKPINETPRYYNLKIRVGDSWYYNDGTLKTVGQKISESKTGKGTPKWKDPSERGRKIAETKKRKFAERLAHTGSKISDEHRQKLSESHAGQIQTEATRKKRSESLKLSYARNR